MRFAYHVLVVGRVLEEGVDLYSEVRSVDSRIELPHEAPRISVLVNKSIVHFVKHLTLLDFL
jgi:hypothetical protein